MGYGRILLAGIGKVARRAFPAQRGAPMHPLVEIQHLTRKELLRGLHGLSDEDARKRVEPMNCISWIIAHVAWQQHAFFVAWAQGKEVELLTSQ